MVRKGVNNPHIFKRAQKGLYHGKTIVFGNRVTFSEKKTRRTWKPNVQRKRIWSDLLERYVRCRLTTTALRNIDRAGGLDNYILYTLPARLYSEFAVKLREEMKQKFLEKTGKKFIKQKIMKDYYNGILRPNFCKAAMMSVEELQAKVSKWIPRVSTFENKYGWMFPDGIEAAKQRKKQREEPTRQGEEEPDKGKKEPSLEELD